MVDGAAGIAGSGEARARHSSSVARGGPPGDLVPRAASPASVPRTARRTTTTATPTTASDTSASPIGTPHPLVCAPDEQAEQLAEQPAHDRPDGIEQAIEQAAPSAAWNSGRFRIAWSMASCSGVAAGAPPQRLATVTHPRMGRSA